MLTDIIEFLPGNVLDRLFDKLKKLRNEKKTELNRIANVFGDPYELSKFYVEPL